jgi:hypothetical protein
MGSAKTMNIIVKYLKRGTDGREWIRRQLIQSPRKDWSYHAIISEENRREGERIISISEAGYH